MIWLTWRQFRAAGAMMAAALAALAVILAVTGPGLADDYSAGITACTAQGRDCSDFVDRFFRDHRSTGLAVTLGRAGPARADRDLLGRASDRP